MSTVQGTTQITSSDGTDPTSHRRSLTLIAVPLVVAFVLACVAFTTPGFATSANLRAILVSASVVGILAVAMTPITLSGNLFSLGVQQSVVVAALLSLYGSSHGWHPFQIVLIVLLAQVALACAQAGIVSAGLNPVITTLAVGSVLYGLMSKWTGAATLTSGGEGMTWLGSDVVLGVPVSVFYFLVFTVLVGLLLRMTVTGRHITLMGANAESAATAGISRRAVCTAVFVIFGAGCAVAGLILASQIGQVAANDFPTLTIDVLAAVLVGGTAIAGGEGSAARSALGAVFMAFLSNVLLLHDSGTGTRLVIIGLAVLASVVGRHLLRREP